MVSLNMTQEEIAQRLMAERLMDPKELSELRERARSERSDLNFSGLVRDVAGRGGVEFGPALSMGTPLAAEFNRDYNVMYDQMFPMFRNHKDTHEAVTEQMAKVWGRSNGQVVKYPPGNYYDMVGGRSADEWVWDQFRRENDIPADHPMYIAPNLGEAPRDAQRARFGERQADGESTFGPAYTVTVVPPGGTPRVYEAWRPSETREEKYLRGLPPAGAASSRGRREGR
jgi:hypothetical protein